MDTLKMITTMVDKQDVCVVLNRVAGGIAPDIPEGVKLLGDIPEDEEVRSYDRQGKPLWMLPDDNAALKAVRKIASRIENNE
jgi:CO dehydrogenase maturation factor